MSYYWRRKSKFNAQPTEVDGFRFDSKVEAEFYRYLKALKSAGEVEHIDVHPIFTLPGGIRFQPDFLVFFKAETEGSGNIAVYDVKGVLTAQARDRKRLFDASHPLAPLIIVRKKGKRWIYER